MRPIAILLAVVLAAPAVLSAQSLAVVAKKEEERRKSVKPATKIYTNKDLKADITASVPAPTNASAAGPTPSTGVPSVNLPGGSVPEDEAEVRDEAYWRSRMTQARSGMERLRIFADALQSRLNALATDIVNRDDPAQRSQLELERQRAIAELERVTQEMAAQAKLIADIEDDARKAGVPPGWLR